MRIVVVGGTGLIGTNAVKRPTEQGHELVPGDNPQLGATRFETWLRQPRAQR